MQAFVIRLTGSELRDWCSNVLGQKPSKLRLSTFIDYNTEPKAYSGATRERWSATYGPPVENIDEDRPLRIARYNGARRGRWSL